MTILFDLDGTLIDSTDAILEGFDVAFKAFNREVDTNKVKRLIGFPLDEMMRKLGVEEELVWDYVKQYKLHYKKISKQKTKLLPFAKDAIITASSFAKIGIVTTKNGRSAKELLENFRVMDYFEVLIGREDVINPKPHPEPILKAIDKLKAIKKATWMIGDTCLDMISAKEAGVNYIGVIWEYDNIVEKKCAKIVMDNVLEAVKFVKKITKSNKNFK